MTFPDGPIVIDDAAISIVEVKNPSFERSATAPLYGTAHGAQCTSSIHSGTVETAPFDAVILLRR